MGDFNCGRNYVPLKSRADIPIFTDPAVKWLVDETVDTTVNANTDYAYDHIDRPGQAPETL